MAVTRINNNQISDASTGNAYVGINAGTKVQPYSITATRLANNLTYGSDLTVTGNLIVQGNTTAIDTTYTTVEDPILLLASNQSGSPSVDIGFVGQRGTSDNIAFVWDESADEFVTVFTTTGESNTTVSIASYANLHTGNLTVTGSITHSGNVIGNLNVSGNIAGGNLLTPGLISAAGNINGAGAAFTGNVTALNFIGNIIGNITGNVDAGGANTQVQFNDNDILNGTAGFTFNKTSNAATVTGNVTGGNLLTAGLISASGNVYTPRVLNGGTGMYMDSGFPGYIQFFNSNGVTVTIGDDGNVNSIANITGANILTGGVVTATGNITSSANVSGANVIATANLVSVGAVVSGNITGGNLLTAGQVSATGNVTGGNLITAGRVIATGNIQSSANVTGANLVASANLVSVGAVVSGNITGGNLLTAGQVSATGNVTGGNVIATSNLVSVGAAVSGNVTGGNLLTGGRVIATGNVQSSANVTGANLVATANVVSVGAVVSGNITGGNLLTAGLVSATGNITSAANIAGGNLTITSAINTGTLNTTGNAVIAGNLFVLGNITYNNVNDLRIEDPVIILGTGPNGAPLTSPDSYDRGTFMEYYTSARGNAWMGWQNSSGNMIAAANVSFSGNDIVSVNAYGTFQAGNIYAQSAVTTGNITGGNLLTAGLISATGNVTGGNLSAGSGIITTTGNINGGNLNATTGVRAATGYFTGNVDVLGNLNASIGVVYANSGIFYGNSVTGNGAAYAGVPGFTPLGSNVVMQFGGNVNSYSQLNFQNINSGNLASTDYIATADNGDDSNYYVNMGINSSTFEDPVNYPGFGPNDSYVHNHGGNLILNPESAGKTIKMMVGGTANVNVIGNVSSTGLAITGLISATSNITSSANIAGANVIASANLVSVGAVVSGNVTGGNLLTAGRVIATGNIQSSANVAGANVIASANLVSVGAVVSGNITGGNLITAGLVSATGNVTGGNLITAGLVSATGNIQSSANVNGANLNATAQVNATGNITGGNLITAGLVSATGNVTSAANINGANVNATTLVTSTTVTATGNITGANVNTSSLTLNGSNINSNSARITINQIDSDVDFAVDGDTVANVFYVDAGTGTVSIGNSTQTTNAILALNATNSFLMPVGNTAQRPGTGVTGMLRFNSTLDAVEVYDTDSWTTVGTPVFTVITDEQFDGDGSTLVFTLAEESTTNSTIVSINGIVQIPTIAYSVGGAGNDELTFTEAPETGDIIDVRKLTTTTQVTSISNSPGNAVIQVNPTSAIVEVTGDLNPSANVTFNLGSNTARWNELYLAGNTIALGTIVIKDVGSNQIGFFQADGTTPATIDSDNVDTTTIANGTSSVSVVASGGNIRANVGGSTVGTFYSGGLSIPGIINSGSNGVGNIGSSAGYFNTVFAKATSAQYADLAEVYAADAAYEPGTVLSFGGLSEVTVSTVSGDARIAGIVSTNPSYVMNATLNSEYTAVVALTGRVPAKVSGPVSKGDMMVSAGNGRAIACATPGMGTVIGKALDNHAGGDGVIEVVVGRL